MLFLEADCKSLRKGQGRAGGASVGGTVCVPATWRRRCGQFALAFKNKTATVNNDNVAETGNVDGNSNNICNGDCKCSFLLSISLSLSLSLDLYISFCCFQYWFNFFCCLPHKILRRGASFLSVSLDNLIRLRQQQPATCGKLLLPPLLLLLLLLFRFQLLFLSTFHINYATRG